MTNKSITTEGDIKFAAAKRRAAKAQKQIDKDAQTLREQLLAADAENRQRQTYENAMSREREIAKENEELAAAKKRADEFQRQTDEMAQALREQQAQSATTDAAATATPSAPSDAPATPSSPSAATFEQTVSKIKEGANASKPTGVNLRNAQQTVTGQTNTYSHSVGNNVGYSEQSGSARSVSEREITPQAKAAGKEVYDSYMRSHGYVPDGKGGWQLDKTLFDVLNIPREKLREERERQEKQNRMKQIAAGLYHSGALLSDMISAGVGGNVWKRDKDDTVSKAAQENNQLRSLQLNEDVAFADKMQKEKEGIMDKAQQLADQRTRDLMRTVSNQNNSNRGMQQGYQTNTTTGLQTTKQGTIWSDDFIARKYGVGGFGGGGSKKSEDILNVHLINSPYGEQTLQLPIGKEAKDALSNKLSTYLETAVKKNPEILNTLIEKGIATVDNKNARGKSKIAIKDLTRLLDEGRAYDIYEEFAPDIMNIYIDALENMKDDSGRPFTRSQIYEMITGNNIHDRKGNIDYYWARDLRAMGLKFGNEKIGSELDSDRIYSGGGIPNAQAGQYHWYANGSDRGPR